MEKDNWVWPVVMAGFFALLAWVLDASPIFILIIGLVAFGIARIGYLLEKILKTLMNKHN